MRKMNHEEAKSTKVFWGSFFVLFVSSWFIFIVSGFGVGFGLGL